MDNCVFLPVVPDLQVSGRILLAEQIDDILVVDLEVADTHFSNQCLLLDPLEDAPDSQGDQPGAVFDSLHREGLP